MSRQTSITFTLGRLVTTDGIERAVTQDEVRRALLRHLDGDWGNVEEYDSKQNDDAVAYGGRICSAYSSQNGTDFLVITEHDRSQTTVLLTDECR